VIRIGWRVAAVGLLGLAACGSEGGGSGREGDETVAGGELDQPVRWRSATLGLEDEADVTVDVVADIDPPVVVAGAGSFDAWVVDGGRVARAEVADLSWQFFELGGTAYGPGPEGAVVAVGTAHPEDETSRPAALVSTDGGRWDLVTDDDLAVPGVLRDVAATADGFVAVGGRIDGTRPTPDTLVPAAWGSADGRQWELLDLGGVLGGSDDHLSGGLVAVAADGERVVVASGTGVWLSPDEGETWEAVELPEPDGVDELVGDVGGLKAAVHGTDGFLLVGVTGGDLEGSRVLAWTSPDGETWVPVSPPEGLLDGVGFPVVVAAADGFVVGGATLIEASVDPAQCYVDIEECGQNRGVVAALEDDSWSLLDTSGAGEPASWRPDALAVTGDDLVVVTRGDGLTVWRHDLAALRRLEPVEPPAPAGPPLVESGARLEVGRTYRYPLYVHCGTGYLGEFNGRHWFAVPGEGIDDRELYEAGLPIVQDNLFGEMTVASEDRIEYRAGDRLVRAYQPKPDEPPTCE
jgi:hypothetical protein